MTTGIEQPLESEAVRPFWSRNESILLAAAIALPAGVFAPIPEIALDILWVCVLCLTIATVTILPAAPSTADLKGFAAWLIAPSLLRIGLVGAATERLLQNRSCGLLAPAIGRAVTFIWPLAATLAGLAAAVVAVFILFAACQKIAAASRRYLKRIRPLKYIGIKTDLKLGIITAEQAHMLAQKVSAETRLFTHLSGASLLIRIEGPIEIAAMLLCLVWPFFGAAWAFDGGNERFTQASAAAIGLAAISLIPATLSAAAGAYLAGKDSLTLRSAPAEQESTGRIFTLVDKQTGQSEEVELLNPDFADHSDSTAAKIPCEQLAEFEPQHNAVLIEALTFSAETAREYYRQLAAHTTHAAGVSRTVVFASERVQDLPVTVFVNTAIQLAQEGKSILLVDADRQRNALAQVFDISVEPLGQAVQPTGFGGLALYGLYTDSPHTRTVLTAAAQDYTCILIYAPDAEAWRELAATVEVFTPTAFLFGITSETRPTGQFASALAECRRIYSAPACPMQT